MAYALLTSLVAQSGNDLNVTSGTFNSSSASLILVGVSAVAGAFLPANGDVTDNKGNTYIRRRVDQSTSDNATTCAIFECASPTGTGSGHTVTFDNGHANFPSITVAVFSGGALSPDDTESGQGPSSSVTSVAPGSITPAEDNELFYAVVGMSGGTVGTVSVDSGFTIHDQADNAAHAVPIAGAYLIQTTAAAKNPTFSWTTARACAAGMVTDKAASVVPPPTVDYIFAGRIC